MSLKNKTKRSGTYEMLTASPYNKRMLQNYLRSEAQKEDLRQKKIKNPENKQSVHNKGNREHTIKAYEYDFVEHEQIWLLLDLVQLINRMYVGAKFAAGIELLLPDDFGTTVAESRCRKLPAKVPYFTRTEWQKAITARSLNFLIYLK